MESQSFWSWDQQRLAMAQSALQQSRGQSKTGLKLVRSQMRACLSSPTEQMWVEEWGAQQTALTKSLWCLSSEQALEVFLQSTSVMQSFSFSMRAMRFLFLRFQASLIMGLMSLLSYSRVECFRLRRSNCRSEPSPETEAKMSLSAEKEMSQTSSSCAIICLTMLFCSRSQMVQVVSIEEVQTRLTASTFQSKEVSGRLKTESVVRLDFSSQLLFSRTCQIFMFSPEVARMSVQLQASSGIQSTLFAGNSVSKRISRSKLLLSPESCTTSFMLLLSSEKEHTARRKGWSLRLLNPRAYIVFSDTQVCTFSWGGASVFSSSISIIIAPAICHEVFAKMSRTSGPEPSRSLKCVQSAVLFSTSPFCPSIREVILPYTTHPNPIRSSNCDQIEYTRSPSLLPSLSPAKKVEGPEVGSSPGQNPSSLEQVGQMVAQQQLVSPRLAPAIPTKLSTCLAMLGPMSYGPVASSFPEPPFTAFLPRVTPMECAIIFTCGAFVQSKTAFINSLILAMSFCRWQFWEARESFPLPQVKVYNSAEVYPWPMKQVARLRNPVCQSLQPSAVPLPQATSELPWINMTGVSLTSESGEALPPYSPHLTMLLQKPALGQLALRKTLKSEVNPQSESARWAVTE